MQAARVYVDFDMIKERNMRDYRDAKLMAKKLRLALADRDFSICLAAPRNLERIFPTIRADGLARTIMSNEVWSQKIVP